MHTHSESMILLVDPLFELKVELGDWLINPLSEQSS